MDEEPGDRSSGCGGVMEPIAVWVRKGGEWAVIHRCRRCGKLSSNRIAADDNPMKLMSIAMKPLCDPPFPLERLEEMTALMGGTGAAALRTRKTACHDRPFCIRRFRVSIKLTQRGKSAASSPPPLRRRSPG